MFKKKSVFSFHLNISKCWQCSIQHFGYHNNVVTFGSSIRFSKIKFRMFDFVFLLHNSIWNIVLEHQIQIFLEPLTAWNVWIQLRWTCLESLIQYFGHDRTFHLRIRIRHCLMWMFNSDFFEYQNAGNILFSILSIITACVTFVSCILFSRIEFGMFDSVFCCIIIPFGTLYWHIRLISLNNITVWNVWIQLCWTS